MFLCLEKQLQKGLPRGCEDQGIAWVCLRKTETRLKDLAGCK